MATVSSQANLIVRDENLEVRQKKAAFDVKANNTKGAGKKRREGIKARRPLGDLTNKRDIHVEATVKKLTAPRNEFNIAEECFLHDHSKCIDAKNAALKLSVLDLILPKCDTVLTDSQLSQDSVRTKVDLDSPLDPDEMEIPDMSIWDSPPPLYKRSNSPPSSPFAWQFEPVEFVLKDEN